MQQHTDKDFETWCERKWHGLSNWAVVPCVVHVSQACVDQARAAYPPDADVEFGVCFRIGASYYVDLRRKYHSGQMRHELAPPMRGVWYVLLYLDHLYVDDREHPVPTRPRRVPSNSV
jgi:hypothetical protein